MIIGIILKTKLFNYQEHYHSLFLKYDQFVRDFNLFHKIFYFDLHKSNQHVKCHNHHNEPISHANAKRKIFDLFVSNSTYMIQTELKADRKVKISNNRPYQFDILLINVPHFLKFRNHLLDNELFHEEINIKKLKEFEPVLICAIELDGTSHTDKHDLIRDNFFFSEYNIVTLRYDTSTLVKMKETEKERKARFRYNHYKPTIKPFHDNITIDNIVEEWRNTYLMKSPHLQ